METSINDGKGDLERGLLGTTEKALDVQCEEWVSKHITATMLIAVVLAGTGFLAYVCVLVLEMHSDVSDLKEHEDNIENINAAISNLRYEISAINAAINGLNLQIENICRHMSC